MKKYAFTLLVFLLAHLCFGQHSEIPEQSTALKKEKPSNKLNRNGLFIDVMGGAFIHKHEAIHYFDSIINDWIYQKYTDPIVGVGLRVGHKFYFGSAARDFRVGIQASSRIEIGFSNKIQAIRLNFANLGFTGIYSISEKHGMEFNLDLGPAIIFDQFITGPQLLQSRSVMAAAISPNMKFRIRNFSIGLDYSRSFVGGVHSSSADLFMVSVGALF